MRFRRARPLMQRELFRWLVLTIVVTALTMAAVFRLVLPSDGVAWGGFGRLKTFVERQFADSWDDSEKRRLLALGLHEALGLSIRVEDASGRMLEQHGPMCGARQRSLEITRAGEPIGTVHACFRSSYTHGPLAAGLALLAALVVLWGAAAVLARKLTRPLLSLIEVTRELGEGKLKSRVRLGHHQRGELRILSESVNEMAGRLERQLDEQRELLAVVSHEVRSPLARLRVSSELLRDDPGNRQALTALEREIAEIDALIGKLLASSRLDFGSIERVPLQPVLLARTALERRALAPGLLVDESDGASCSGDPTLIARALDNLLDNAERHGASVLRLLVRRALPEERAGGAAIAFEVWDTGPGFDPTRLADIFTAFSSSRGRSAGTTAPSASRDGHVSLGLGLSLVRRIAEAHHGRAWAENLPDGGARVSISLG